MGCRVTPFKPGRDHQSAMKQRAFAVLKPLRQVSGLMLNDWLNGAPQLPPISGTQAGPKLHWPRGSSGLASGLRLLGQRLDRRTQGIDAEDVSGNGIDLRLAALAR